MSEGLIPKYTLRWRPVMFLVIFIVPLVPYWGLKMSPGPKHYNLWAWWGIFVYHIAGPVIEHLIGKDCSGQTDEQIQALEKRKYYNLIIVAIIPAQIVLLLYGAYIFSTEKSFNLFGQIGWVYSNGICSATLSMIAGHELIHREKWTDQLAGTFLLATVCNTGFKIDHLRGHHADLATPNDAYSAPLNQSIFLYIPRAIYRNLVDPWKLEGKRLDRKGRYWFSWRNEMIPGYTATTILATLFLVLFGVYGLLFFIAQSIAAWVILHSINYIQHYGLIRHKTGTGSYEHPAPSHSWNCNYWWCNILLLHLPRHADHHLHPRRSFQALHHIDESPQMPFGYSIMIILPLIPPLWFRIINPRVLKYHHGGQHENSGPA